MAEAEGYIQVQGPAGVRGPQGECGRDGRDGREGEAGPRGAQGECGPEGCKGDPGPRGNTGPRGDTGSQGPAAPDPLKETYLPGDTLPAWMEGTVDVTLDDGTTVTIGAGDTIPANALPGTSVQVDETDGSAACNRKGLKETYLPGDTLPTWMQGTVDIALDDGTVVTVGAGDPIPANAVPGSAVQVDDTDGSAVCISKTPILRDHNGELLDLETNPFFPAVQSLPTAQAAYPEYPDIDDTCLRSLVLDSNGCPSTLDERSDTECLTARVSVSVQQSEQDFEAGATINSGQLQTTELDIGPAAEINYLNDNKWPMSVRVYSYLGHMNTVIRRRLLTINGMYSINGAPFTSPINTGSAATQTQVGEGHEGVYAHYQEHSWFQMIDKLKVAPGDTYDVIMRMQLTQSIPLGFGVLGGTGDSTFLIQLPLYGLILTAERCV